MTFGSISSSPENQSNISRLLPLAGGQLQYYNRLRPGSGINLHFLGAEICRTDNFNSGIRNYYLLHLILEGYGFAGEERLGAGDSFCYFPGEEMNYYPDQHEPWTYLWFGFSGIDAPDLMNSCGFSVGKHSRKSQAGLYRKEALIRLFLRLIELQSDRKPEYGIMSDGLFLQIIGLLSLSGSSPRTPGSGKQTQEPGALPPAESEVDYVREAKDFIFWNFQRNIGVRDVAAYVGLSRSYLSGLFHKQEGKTIQRFIIMVRMERARHMLIEHRLSISEVAHSVGYREYSSFARRYHLEFGCAPGDQK